MEDNKETFRQLEAIIKQVQKENDRIKESLWIMDHFHAQNELLIKSFDAATQLIGELSSQVPKTPENKQLMIDYYDKIMKLSEEKKKRLN